MKEQGFEDNEPQEQEQHDGNYVLKFFATPKDASPAKAERSEVFLGVANQMISWLPQGTLRTAMLERLLDVRDVVVKNVR